MSEDSSSERAVVRPSAEVRRSVGEISGEGASSSMRASSSRKAALAYSGVVSTPMCISAISPRKVSWAEPLSSVHEPAPSLTTVPRVSTDTSASSAPRIESVSEKEGRAASCSEKSSTCSSADTSVETMKNL